MTLFKSPYQSADARDPGTSMAAGFSSGAPALLLQQNPSLNPDQVKAKLMKTAAKAPTKSATITDSSSGIPYIPLAMLPAPPPVATYNSTSVTATRVLPANAIWGSNAIWGYGSPWAASDKGSEARDI